MNPEHTPTPTVRNAHVSIFARRGMETACWILAIVLLALYCGARSYGELERRDTLAQFIQSRSP